MLLLADNYLVAWFIYAKYFLYQFSFISSLLNCHFFYSVWELLNSSILSTFVFCSLEPCEVREWCVGTWARLCFCLFDLFAIKVVHPWARAKDSFANASMRRAEVLCQCILDVVDIRSGRLEPERFETILCLRNRTLRLVYHVGGAEPLSYEVSRMVMTRSGQFLLFV